MNTKKTKGQAAKGKNKQGKNFRKSKKTDSEILQHYNLLQAAIEATSDAIFIKDIDGRYLIVNSAAAGIFGKSSAEIIGLDDTQLWPPEIAQKQIESDRRIISTGVCETFEEVLPAQDKQRTYTIAKSLYRNEQANILGVICTARDITERKELERELAIRQARFDAFFATAPAGLLIFDEELCYMQINEALAEVNGIAIADHIGKTVGEVLPELAPAVEPMFRQILATGEPKYNIEVSGETPLQPRVQRHWMVSYFPLIGSYNNPIGLGGVVVEITSLKRAEAALRQYQEQLEDLVTQRTALLTKANEQLQQEIASRQEAVEALRNSEERYRAIFDKAAVGIADASLDGRFLRVNPKFCSIVGYTNSELLTRSFLDITHPDDSHADMQAFTTLLAGEIDTYSMEKRYIRKDGSIVWVNLTVSMVREFNGEPEYTIGVVEDISSRKALEKELALRQARFDAFFQTANAGMVIFDRDLRYVQINETLAQINGRSVAEHLGKTVSEVLPDLAPIIDPQFRRILITGEPLLNDEISGYTAKEPGVKRYWISSHFPLVGEDGFIGIGGVVTEITERKQAEAEMQRSYNLLRSVIESTPDLVFVKDLQGRYVMLNSPAASLFGKSIEEAIGKRDDELIPLEIARQLQENDKRIITNGVAEVIEEVGLENQQTKTFLSSKSPWRDAEGNIIGLIGISRDISDRKQAEEILRRSEQALKKQAQREALINRLASQIRNSLNLDTILQTAVEEIRNVLQIDCCTFAWYLPDANPPACEVVHEAKPPNFPSILGYYPTNLSSPLVRQVLEQQIIRVDDMRTIGDPLLSQGYLSLGFISALVLPIQTKMGEIGTFSCNHTQERPWSDSEVELLIAVGVQVAIAIEQAKLYQQTRTAAAIAQAQAKKQELLNQLASQIRNSLDLDTIVKTAVQEIRDLMQVDWCGFSWIRYEADPPVWVVSHEAKNSSFSSQLGTFLIEESSPLVEKMLQMEILRTEDVSTLKDSITRQNLIDLGINSILSLPIPTQKGEIGVIHCHYAGEGLRYWSDAEVELLQAVADQVAIAIEQARLYEQTRTSAANAQAQAQQLQQTLEELQLTQSQLIQSEKMSSLGQLVAGVAHEINNPVNFIYGNLTHVNEYAQNLLGLLQLYQQNYPNPTPAIVEEMDAIELDFIMEDLPKILSSMRVGADRIREIVLSLRTFSRLDEADMKEVNIHEGIDSTLLILQNRFKAKPEHPAIELVKEYGNLPLVECYPGQLNQVFMNILTNAIDAIEEYNKQRYIAMCQNRKSEETRSHSESKNHPSTITIRSFYTKVQNSAVNSLEQKITDFVRIIIADNGPGMAESVRKRLFDPFFTTKPIGKGTGLGLAISYQIIVEKHRGAISCHSVLGKGAEFVIEIPVRQPLRCNN